MQFIIAQYIIAAIGPIPLGGSLIQQFNSNSRTPANPPLSDASAGHFR